MPSTNLDRGRSTISSRAGVRASAVSFVAPRGRYVHDSYLDVRTAGVTMPTSAKAGRREWTGLAVIALPCLVYAMDLTVLNLALPTLSEDLRPSSSQLLWIVDIYGFLVAGLLITMGTLGDRIGRRRLLLIGAGAFGLASLFAAFSTSAEMLIAARALLGIAGATLAPSTLSLIRNMFSDPQERTFAIGVWITSFSAGAAVGPLIGGLLLERFCWGSVFLPALPVMALLLVVGPRLLPEYRDPEARRLDLISAAISLVAVLALIFGLKQIAQDGVGWTAALSIGAGLAIGAAFVHRQGRLDDPLIDLRLFRLPAFNTALAANTLGFFVNFGIAVFIAQYLQLVLGLSPFEAGLWTVPYASAFIVGSLLTPLLVRLSAPAFVIAGGLALASAGFVLLTQVDADSGLATLVTGSVVFALGLAPVYTLAADMMVGAAPPERAGAAAGISETSSEFGGALGIAVLGAIGTAVYRGRIDDGVPAAVPPDAAAAARDTLGGAVAAGDALPAQSAPELVEAAREAFTQALQVVATLSAAVALGAAILAVAMLKRVRMQSELEEEQGLVPDRALAGGRPC
jgi:MFS transporter, DHA2 family, multidrug resistance protein